ncbi:peptidase s45 penicillin amidase, putative [Ichthyophthirius multifiliis]|uniref:Peptidase s45 penicillin amidase, putative n=1 Tax=Ichthyophthirius multifiliis TaxID=5932 RepID=G0QRA3_ICHMU|nr:peptidase s45 penicillin amidase, putative [Ichthyophthirius multifiliis]EGR32255.1 peptidase s45 penicillin amidase, putative [Ichthyophthirius multifiliis]|eukprot:XP_004035741.1 peptidase s45 penicillin amidase, putative [Ichthyophthirius multifiliis]
MILKLIFIIFFSIILSIYLLFRPNYNGLITHNNAKYGTINIRRDNNGIPHIKGKTLNDVCFGQGFVHGQDRLFQIHIKKQLINGKLSLLSGEKSLQIDKFFRTVGIHRIAKKIAEKLQGEQKQCIQAYCDGINHYYNSLNIKPLEFYLVQQDWQDYRPEDVIGQERLLIFLLGYDYVWEAIRSNLAEQFGFEEAQLITGAISDSQFVDVTIMDDQDLKNNNLYEKYQRNSTKNYLNSNQKKLQNNKKHQNFIDSQIADVLNELYMGPNGSNAWVIHGNHTKSGKPLLASDPHLQSSIPTQWIQNELLIESENILLIGGSIPGVPLIQNGRSEFFSWGTTVLYADTADLYKETIEDNKYLLDNKWIPLQTVEELIYIKGQNEPYVHNVKLTHRGPILNNRFDKTSKTSLTEIGVDASLVWIGQILSSNFVDSILVVARSQNTQQCVNAFKQMIGPALSIVYATKTGDIGFFGYGKIPIIEDSAEGAFLKDGTSSKQDWLRFTNSSENPQMMNPSKGYIVTANNRFASDNILNHLTVNQLSTSRALRINQLIQEHINKGLKFDIEDMKRIQSDTVDSYAQLILPHLIQLYEKKGMEVLGNDQKLYQKGLKMLNLLKDWDSNLSLDSFKASIFMSWEYLFCQKSLMEFDAQEKDRKTITMGLLFENYYFKKIKQWSTNEDTNYDYKWCKNKENQNSKFSCLYNVIYSFTQIEDFLYTKFQTTDHNEWKWGKMHRNILAHQAFTKNFLRHIFDRKVEIYGNRRTIAVSLQNWIDDTFDSSYVANYRMIVDMNDNKQDYWVVEAGVSENIFSGHYDDQMSLHKNFQYLYMQRGFENFEKNKYYSQDLKYKENKKKDL